MGIPKTTQQLVATLKAATACTITTDGATIGGVGLAHQAAAEIERLCALLERSKRGEHICLKCGLREDGYDAAAHAAAYPGF